ncbi:MAG: glycosyltransferase family 4 protein [Deltaproteobacteria bacterium]|nr:glycosyltransferase family 4 protein [Deltaproteobacteria bacterium]
MISTNEDILVFKKPSILMLAACPFPTSQGTQVMIRHLVNCMTDRGFNVKLLTYNFGDFKGHTKSNRSGPSFKKLLLDLYLLVKALHAKYHQQFEVIHAHGFEALALGLLLKKILHVPLIYHAHSALGLELPTYFKLSSITSFAGFAGRVFDNTLPRLADAVIVFDSHQRALYQSFGVAKEKIFTIPPGINAADLGELDPIIKADIAKKLGRGPWIIYTGNPDAYQNLPLLYQTIQILRHQLPAVRLLIASHHDEEQFLKTHQYIAVRDRVDFYQYSSQSEIRALIALATVGVCSRIMHAGAPIKVLNYLATGIPVVACHAGAQHLVSNKCGRLVDANPMAMAQGIVEVFKTINQVDYATECKKAYARFDITQHISRYADLYMRVTLMKGSKKK